MDGDRDDATRDFGYRLPCECLILNAAAMRRSGRHHSQIVTVGKNTRMRLCNC